MYATECISFHGIYINWPLNDTWTDFAKTGEEKAPSYYQLDLKFNYGMRLYGTAIIDLFLDVYNVTNNQAAIDFLFAHNDDRWDYKEVTKILLPMRFYAGARIRF